MAQVERDPIRQIELRGTTGLGLHNVAHIDWVAGVERHRQAISNDADAAGDRLDAADGVINPSCLCRGNMEPLARITGSHGPVYI
ncbi:hypothetical protein [Methylobacterium oxalidis]|uniref:hypothetical protein n=1 Tax=Methylobacterium oxalidis TaxID=944322 RepID=UPI0033155C8D